jgi:hypothetical protein
MGSGILESIDMGESAGESMDRYDLGSNTLNLFRYSRISRTGDGRHAMCLWLQHGSRGLCL